MLQTLERCAPTWVAEIPAISGCYAMMPTRESALAELTRVFESIAREYRKRDLPLPPGNHPDRP